MLTGVDSFMPESGVRPSFVADDDERKLIRVTRRDMMRVTRDGTSSHLLPIGYGQQWKWFSNDADRYC